MPKNQRSWTEAEENKLRRLRAKGVAFKELSKLFDRSPAALRQKLYHLGLTVAKLPQHKFDRRCHVSIPCRYLDPIRPYARAEGVSMARYIVNLIDRDIREHETKEKN